VIPQDWLRENAGCNLYSSAPCKPSDTNPCISTSN